MARSNITALRQRKIELTKKQRGLLDVASAEDRDMTEAEAAQFDDGIVALTKVEEDIQRAEKVLAFERSQTPSEDDNAPFALAAGNGGGNGNGGPRGGAAAAPKPFTSFGEQLIAVVKSGMNQHDTDQRLIQASISGMSETVPSDGGFLVQKDFSDTLLQRTYELGYLTSKVLRIPVSANSNGTKINAIDEDSRVDGSRWGGVLAYWQNEADTKVGTKTKFRQIELNLKKLTGLCYATDEILQDAAALEAVIMQTFPQEFNFKVEDAIVNGTGAGQPLGFMNSGAVLQVAKDAADSGPTVSTNDVLAMWSRCWGRSRLNAAWLINQDVEPKLYPLTLGSGTAVQLLYTPPGARGNEGGQYGLLLGRPVVPVEYCATLGTPGDIILADLSQYVMIDKGAPQAASSIHVRFINDETTFRFVYRVDGQPTWKKPLTPKNGTNTYSPFITLATRS
jgi:HK97 family phage major capsid protein